ncbi:MAG: protein-L-isoaspartate(D-aspartate) O-methyltransferase [Candidatus Kapaibacterium sp.]
MRPTRSESLPNDITAEELIAVLRAKGIRDERVLHAIRNVRRELFVPKIFVRKAYNDVALPIGHDQTISQPYTVAFMTQELDVHEGHSVLEIGTGSGYQAAVLAALGAKLTTIERRTELFVQTSKLLSSLVTDITCLLGDGSAGAPESAPFDRIIVTAGAPVVPDSLRLQLGVGGRLVVPVGDEGRQKMVVIDRESETAFRERVAGGSFSFVPLIGREGWDDRSGGPT